MIDFNNLEKYRENNRVEAKKALGGLPKSIWETYSAFANTLGGLILLGVEEYKDRSLHPVDLPDPEGMIREFWSLVNDPRKASINILSSGDVYQAEAEGNHIIVIDVPRADRSDKPVYIDGDPSNTYRRNGEGDYKCTREEYEAMARDAAVKTQDMRLLDEMDTSVLNLNSLRDYRQRMKAARPGHVWEQLDDETFLQRIGAAGIEEDGKEHPTAAGLLMFGKEADIVIFGITRKTGPFRFLADERRLNVALSRAKDQLIIVGNREYAEKKRLLAKIADACKVVNDYPEL